MTKEQKEVLDEIVETNAKEEQRLKVEGLAKQKVINRVLEGIIVVIGVVIILVVITVVGGK